ncbi:probable tRNA pseudouridine synthase 1 isoform X1 [Dioscorea cayenensis subsp. rotundata]|uniref:tRNA pseudouridine(55) synthase n=1 Tax=Dioscorea cayennensis subsp. rotundata TaxID=55577 RepID=A0AB40C2G0_DIOCR|nr:probable tRNA pseudouridine synthase 1 isoform X1 [Dioscorea cayenensis subsp. rotundata]XP_039133538.1 probable tRNA pseudouridine synthase 1 isoform X1 [Dioscorea cayenensis subsp. rotundata]XP_039133539.1 probable tRNA pseudouridine synthase 1 isoform X1 [Dioscorea cayenensis subsp. rotundata]
MLNTSSRALSSLIISSKLHPIFKPSHFRPFSTTSTPYPLYYELVHHRPVRSPPPPRHHPHPSPSPEPDPDSPDSDAAPPLDRSQRKYYRKRMKRMYGGSDSEEDARRARDEELVELKPEVVDFPRLHAREQELYFYDAFAFPWEKDKHYRMVYQLEKKYFPEHSLDKAFVDPEAEPVRMNAEEKKGKKRSLKKKVGEEESDQRGLVFFDGDGQGEAASAAVSPDVVDKKVESFFKSLSKVPSASDRRRASTVEAEGEPYLVSRKTELPPRWDGPFGTVVLVDKPKGWTSFTVCGKLRRLVKIQKVGHAGTLDPMATGLLIVCVGKATKLVERYQGMVKGYSGIFRLGEATSTWDADSPVIQREPWEHIKDEYIRKTAASFLGEIWQVPPMFSAIKVGGEKMYDKARRGEMVELSPRRISIFDFAIERSLEDRQNLIFRVTCSKGTYIRSLCADLGKALGSCAHLTALRRDSIGEYLADDAWSFQELQEKITKGYL